MPKKKKSFTLIEVLIAMAILAVGLLSAFYLFPLSLKQIRLSRNLMDLSFFAKEKLEELKTYGEVEGAQGESNNLKWSLSVENIEPIQGIRLRKFILNVKSDPAVGASLEEEFITYFPDEE